jgi:LysM repeat protein
MSRVHESRTSGCAVVMGVNRRPARAAASLAGVALLVAGVPALLVAAARGRFGGAAPWHGVEPPASWSYDRIRTVLGSRLDDDVLLDGVVRVSLGVAWAAVVVLTATIAAETVHMVRHGGLALPAVRGLGWSQRIARTIAAGLLVLTPLTSMSRVHARASTVLAARATAAATHVHRAVHTSVPAGDVATPADGAAPTASDRYVVASGDSVYAIAARIAAGDAALTAVVADVILDRNLGTVMNDGQLFRNAAYIQPGWVLEVPRAPIAPASAGDVHVASHHVVRAGETLSSIAADELGDPNRWPELWLANAGSTVEEGRTFDDPDLIVPGWSLEIPTARADGTRPEGAPATSPTASTAPTAPESPSPATPIPAPATTPPTPATTPPPSPATPTPPTTTPPTPPTTSPTPGSTTTPPPTPAGSTTTSTTPGALAPTGGLSADPTGRPSTAPSPIGLGHAGMVAAGLLALMAARRRRRLRAARPQARVPTPPPASANLERVLRSVDASERLLRLDIAIRSVAMALAEADRRVVAALVAPTGGIELLLDGPAVLGAPWAGESARWRLPGAVELDALAATARNAGFPCHAVVQLGVTATGEDLFVDVEAMGVLAIVAAPTTADAVVCGIATTLGCSVFAELAHLVGVGIDERAFAGHARAHSVADVDDALEIAASLVGATTAVDASTFALRARHTSGESWEPAVVLLGSSAATAPGAVPNVLPPGLAAVAGFDVAGAPHVLRDTGATWRLEPLGLDVVPVGLTSDEIGAVDGLLRGADELPRDAAEPAVPAAAPVLPVQARDTDPSWSLLVRILGPVDVVDRELRPVPLERSKTRELIVWLATHRQRATRTAARTALWELDVRDATFANIVSEARRAMARLVPPPDGGEWLLRTLTEELRLDPAVVTDADVLAARVAAARGRPPDVAVQVLEPAVEMIRGVPFEGTSYLWPDGEGITSNLVLLATSAAAELASHHLALGDVAGVFAATAQGLRVLPGHEELIALRMHAHARAGDLAGVRHEWASYERVITADPWSDGEPAPKLLALRRDLLSSTA